MEIATATTVFYTISYSLTCIFPFLILFGFFESRTDGSYRFRINRLLTVFACLFAMNLGAGFADTYGSGLLISKPEKSGESGILRIRALGEFKIHNQGIIFPKS